MNVIARARRIFIQAQQHIDTHALVRLHDIVEYIIGTVEKQHGANSKQGYVEIMHEAGAQTLKNKVADEEG